MIAHGPWYTEWHHLLLGGGAFLYISTWLAVHWRRHGDK